MIKKFTFLRYPYFSVYIFSLGFRVTQYVIYIPLLSLLH
jgi:hypothetical protein